MIPLLKTSAEWQVLVKDLITVLGFEGWSRSDYKNRWLEKISFEEFKSRCEIFTCAYPKGTRAFFALKESDLIPEELPHGDDKDL